MALISIFSAKGAPGVTTTALGLALHWPNPVVLAEVDLAGSSIIPGYMAGQIPHTGGLVELALARNRNSYEWSLRNHTIEIASDVDFLAGLSHPNQARAMASLWADLVPSFTSLEDAGIDVILDLGRIAPVDDPRQSLLNASDVQLLMTKTRLADVLTTRKVAQSFAEDQPSEEFARTYLLTVATQGGYATRDVAKACGLPALASLTWDTKAAAVLSDGTKTDVRRFERSRLVRDLHVASASIKDRISRRRKNLVGEANT